MLLQDAVGIIICNSGTLDPIDKLLKILLLYVPSARLLPLELSSYLSQKSCRG